MNEAVDAVRFPRVAAYLRTLPGGSQSHPQCTARGSLVRSILEEKPIADLAPGSLPEPVLVMMRESSPPNTRWVHEAELMCISLAFADYHHLSDAAYRARKFQQNCKLFRGLIYRVIVSFNSPGMLLGVAQSRWNSVHRGTSVEMLAHGDSEAELRMDFPEHIFNELTLQMYAEIFRAVLACSNAKTSQVDLAQFTPTSARFAVRWG